MSITATELKNNLGKYLILSATEDIFITKNGKIIAKLTNPDQDRVETAKSLFGILPKDVDLEEAKAERLGAKQMKILVETNVVIDALTGREPWNESAEKIFLLGANHIMDMYITASSATDPRAKSPPIRGSTGNIAMSIAGNCSLILRRIAR